MPEALPHLNTMSDTHALYGRVEEFLRVRVDDGGASGVPCAACAALGNSLLLDFNVLIVSDNDPPRFARPAGGGDAVPRAGGGGDAVPRAGVGGDAVPPTITVMQNEATRLGNLTLLDPDAQDLTMGQAAARGGAQTLVSCVSLYIYVYLAVYLYISMYICGCVSLPHHGPGRRPRRRADAGDGELRLCLSRYLCISQYIPICHVSVYLGDGEPRLYIYTYIYVYLNVYIYLMYLYI